MDTTRGRRRFIAALGAGGLGFVAGCSSGPAGSQAGLRLKAVTVRWEAGGATHEDEILRIGYNPSTNSVTGQYEPTYASAAARPPTEITVNEQRHTDLKRNFFEIEYLLGVCGSAFAADGEDSGCRNAPTSRTDFNRVQFTDRCRVAERGNSLDVLDVEEGVYEVDSVDLQQVDFEELYGENAP